MSERIRKQIRDTKGRTIENRGQFRDAVEAATTLSTIDWSELGDTLVPTLDAFGLSAEAAAWTIREFMAGFEDEVWPDTETGGHD
jgi:hypothetical protein